MISRTDIISSDASSSGRMLGPSAYSEALLPSLRLARSSRYARQIGKMLLASLILGFALVTVAPWRQSVIGNGYVIAYDPSERPQKIQAQVKGRVIKWGEKVEPNAHVKKGDLIAEIQDIDQFLVGRLDFQVEAGKTKVDALKARLLASQRNKGTKEDVVVSQQSLLETYKSAKLQILASADALIAGAANKVEAEKKQLEEVEAALTQIEADFNRQQQLFEEKIVAQVKFQLAERKYLEAQAKVSKAKAYVSSAQNDLLGKQRDRDAKEQKAQGDIDYAKSQVDKAKGEVLKAETEVQKATSELSEAQKMLSELETKVARQQGQIVTAPVDGFLTSITSNRGGIMVKEGDTLCVIVPDTKERAVEVWLDGNDASIVQPGRHVRLQFEGWPAVQSAGWPSIAVGTFGGRVVSVDATDDGKGKFRVVVRPYDEPQGWPDDKREGWPKVRHSWPDDPDRFLRQGVRAHAWVLLDQVPLWYEVWRNMNGFPPEVTDSDEGKDKPKKPKLPK